MHNVHEHARGMGIDKNDNLPAGCGELDVLEKEMQPDNASLVFQPSRPSKFFYLTFLYLNSRNLEICVLKQSV